MIRGKPFSTTTNSILMRKIGGWGIGAGSAGGWVCGGTFLDLVSLALCQAKQVNNKKAIRSELPLFNFIINLFSYNHLFFS